MPICSRCKFSLFNQKQINHGFWVWKKTYCLECNKIRKYNLINISLVILTFGIGLLIYAPLKLRDNKFLMWSIIILITTPLSACIFTIIAIFI